MHKKIIITAASLICLAIALGAMAAHGLKNILTEELLESFEKGVRYQFYAGFSILILSLAADKFSFSLKWFYRLTLVGVLLFSFCIYAYCFHTQIPALHNLVILVPFGGISFILAWVIFISNIVRKGLK